MGKTNPNTLFPLEQPTLVSNLAAGSIAGGDFVLIYDVSAGEWKTATITDLTTVINV